MPTTRTRIDILAVTAESTNALRARITRMGSKATTTRLAQALGADREVLKTRLEADDTFTTHRSVWHVARYAPVGAVVHNRYWNFVYRVVEHRPGPFGSDEIVVEKLDHPRTSRAHYPGDPAFQGGRHVVGSVWSHSTALDKRDEILSLPASRVTALAEGTS